MRVRGDAGWIVAERAERPCSHVLQLLGGEVRALLVEAGDVYRLDAAGGGVGEGGEDDGGHPDGHHDLDEREPAVAGVRPQRSAVEPRHVIFIDAVGAGTEAAGHPPGHARTPATGAGVLVLCF